MFSPENLAFAHKIKLFQNMKLLKELGTQTKKKMPVEFQTVNNFDAKKDKKDIFDSLETNEAHEEICLAINHHSLPDPVAIRNSPSQTRSPPT